MVNEIEKIWWETKIELSVKQRLDLLKTEVYESIKKDFWVSLTTAKRLSFLKTETWLNSLENLKQKLKSSDSITENDKNTLLSLTDDRLEDLYNAVVWAEKILKTPWIEKIDIFKSDSTISKNIFTLWIYKKVLYPENAFDQVIWLWIWSVESFESTIKLLIDIWIWIIKSPYHIYLIISWKWEYKFNI